MAVPMKLYGKDLSAYEDINIDELLDTLSAEDLEQLGRDLIDPDDSCIPPSERCAYKTDKKPSGTFNRKALIDFLETKAKEEKDWDEAKPYVKEIRGRVWKPKEEARIQINEDDAVDTEWDDVLAHATEEELVDLAAILGFHGMLNQVQYHKAFIDNDENADGDENEDDDGKEKKPKAGFQGVAKHQDFKLVKDEPPNATNVDESLKQLKGNAGDLKELNLNNIKGISLQQLKEFAEALKTNKTLESFCLANTKVTDRVAKAFADALRQNKTLKALNMESNYISGEAIVEILDAISEHQTLVELRLANQRPQLLGVKVEMRIAEIMQYNYTLLRFGIFLEVPDARVRLQQYLQRNNDTLRTERMGLPTPERAAKPVKKEFKKREKEGAPPKALFKPSEKEEVKEEKEASEEEEDSEEEESDEE